MSAIRVITNAKMHSRLRAIIRAGGGGKFLGVLGVPRFLGQPGYMTVYFDSPATGSTMTMLVRGLTAEKVRQHLKESDAKFGILTR